MLSKIYAERYYLFDPKIIIGFQFVLEEFDKERLIKAIYETLTKTTMCCSSIEIDKEGRGYYKINESSNCKISETDKGYHEILLENESIPFDIFNGELIRIFINEKQSRIYILAHHLFGDGKSVLILYKRIIESYLNKLDDDIWHTLNEEEITKRCKVNIFLRLMARMINRKWKKVSNNKVFSKEDYYTVYQTHYKNHSSKIVSFDIDENKLKILLMTAKTNNVTLTSLLCTILSKAGFNEGKMGLACSIRNNKTISNQVSGIRFKSQYNNKVSLNKNISKTHKRIYRIINNPNKMYLAVSYYGLINPTFFDGMIFTYYALYKSRFLDKLKFIYSYSDKYNSSIGISNLIKEEDILLTKEIEFTPPITSFSLCNLGIITYNNMTTFSFHYEKEEDLFRFNKFIEEINKIVS